MKLKVKSIRKIEKQVVYDIEVENNHTYTVTKNNINVHNSGKGFVTQNLLGLEGKILDVDALKVMAKKSSGIIKKVKETMGIDIKTMSLKDPENVSRLHKIIKDLGLDKNRKASLYASILAGNPERRPNIIFDVTMDSVSKLSEISQDVSALGYKKENIHIVWVVNDFKVAIEQNKGRERVVPEDILIGTHEGAALTLKKVTSFGSDVKKYMDGVIVFAFNKQYVDSELASSGKGGMYVVQADYITVKEKGKKIDSAKLTKDVVSKIVGYTPVPNKWA